MNALTSKYWKGLIITLIFGLSVIPHMPKDFYDLGGDSAQYIITAESLAQGKGLRMLNLPQEPLCSYYPPVFPLLLYPIISAFGRNFYLMHILVALLGCLSLFLFYKIFERITDGKTALLTIGLLSANWIFNLYCAQYILSDIPYLFFSGLTIFLFDKYTASVSPSNKKVALCILGLLTAYFTRYAGITLFIGEIACLFLSSGKGKLKKIAFLSAGFIPAVILWRHLESISSPPAIQHAQQILLIDPYAPFKGNLLQHPSQFIVRLIEGINYYYNLLADIFFPFLTKGGALFKECLAILSLGLILTGLWQKFRRGQKERVHYYFFFYSLLIIFWPFREGIRFLIPILPMLCLYFLTGIHTTLALLFKRPQASFAVAFIIIIFSALYSFSTLNKSRPAFNRLPGSLQNFLAMHEWISKNTADSNNIISRKPSITYFYTGHKSAVYPYTADPEEIWRAVTGNKAGYILVDEFSRETYAYLLPFLYQYANKLTLIHRIGDTGLFMVLKEK